jgi:hypothetical protein
VTAVHFLASRQPTPQVIQPFLGSEVKALQPTLFVLDRNGNELNRLALAPYDLRNPIETMALINEICSINHRQAGEIRLQLQPQSNANLELNDAIQTLNAALKALVKFDYALCNSPDPLNTCDALALNLSWIEELIALVADLFEPPVRINCTEYLETTSQLETTFSSAIL